MNSKSKHIVPIRSETSNFGEHYQSFNGYDVGYDVNLDYVSTKFVSPWPHALALLPFGNLPLESLNNNNNFLMMTPPFFFINARHSKFNVIGRLEWLNASNQKLDLCQLRRKKEKLHHVRWCCGKKKKNCYTSENGTQISLSLDSFPWRKIDFYLFKERNVVIRLNLIYWKKSIYTIWMLKTDYKSVWSKIERTSMSWKKTVVRKHTHN